MMTRSKQAVFCVSILLVLIFPSTLATFAQQNAPQWNGESRFTVLLLGMDRRPGARDTLSVRTDVIMLASIDPRTGSAGILSIPRDMHFAPPGSSDMLRVNTLLVEGEKLQEGYGPYFAIETLQLNLGMYIDAYIAFDFEAFVALIDAIGGVTVNVPYNIADPAYPDMNYGVDPFYLQRGVQTFDGATALKYARTRHGDNDYLRGERQLQIVDAVRQQLSDPAVLQSLLPKAPALFSQFQNNLYTDLSPDQMLLLGIGLLQIPEANIHTGAINIDYSFDYTSLSGVVRVPDRTKLVELLIEVFGENYWQG